MRRFFYRCLNHHLCVRRRRANRLSACIYFFPRYFLDFPLFYTISPTYEVKVTASQNFNKFTFYQFVFIFFSIHLKLVPVYVTETRTFDPCSRTCDGILTTLRYKCLLFFFSILEKVPQFFRRFIINIVFPLTMKEYSTYIITWKIRWI